jgi:hypothetical protein
MNPLRKKIGFLTSANDAAAAALFKTLSAAFPELLESAAETDDPNSFSGIIYCNVPARYAGVPHLFLRLVANPVEKAIVKFGSAASVPAVFRNREVKQSQAALLEKGDFEAGDEIIASAGGAPVWTGRAGGVRSQSSAMSLKTIESSPLFFKLLSGEHFVQVLPVLDFIRHVTEEDRWTPPPLRANIMFDDPNLHGVRYGWLDYSRLIKSAIERNYQASFATIPIDAWFTSRKSAELLRAHPAQISLLVHGNNHLSDELASFPSAEVAIRELSQAFNRIRALERKAGVEVSKVIAAPHGACSEMTLGIMCRIGYEGACISHGSLYGHNKDKEWTRRIGAAIAEVVEGTPVMPRFRVSYDCLNSALLSAYLHQPIVPVGHHEDAADGLKMVETVADFINTLGDVHWCDMKTLCRGNFFSRIEGDELRIRSFSRICDLQIPPGVTRLSVERHWVSNSSPEGLRIGCEGRNAIALESYGGESLPVSPGSTVSIASVRQDMIDPAPVRGGVNLWAFTRRQLCECRDRLKPAFR